MTLFIGQGYDIITIGIIALTTLPVVIFAKGQPVPSKDGLTDITNSKI